MKPVVSAQKAIKEFYDEEASMSKIEKIMLNYPNILEKLGESLYVINKLAKMERDASRKLGRVDSDVYTPVYCYNIEEANKMLNYYSNLVCLSKENICNEWGYDFGFNEGYITDCFKEYNHSLYEIETALEYEITVDDIFKHILENFPDVGKKIIDDVMNDYIKFTKTRNFKQKHAHISSVKQHLYEQYKQLKQGKWDYQFLPLEKYLYQNGFKKEDIINIALKVLHENEIESKSSEILFNIRKNNMYILKDGFYNIKDDIIQALVKEGIIKSEGCHGFEVYDREEDEYFHEPWDYVYIGSHSFHCKLKGKDHNDAYLNDIDSNISSECFSELSSYEALDQLLECCKILDIDCKGYEEFFEHFKSLRDEEFFEPEYEENLETQEVR